MSCEFLDEFIKESSPSKFNHWYLTQIARARGLRNGLARNIGQVISSDIIPEEEIVNETIDRMLSNQIKYGKYTWNEERTFEEHFISCLKMTLNSLWTASKSSKRRLELGLEFHISRCSRPAEPDQNLEHSQATIAIDQLLNGTNRSGKILEYMKNLPKYVSHNASTEEIAKDLEVKETSVPQYRTRARRIIDESGR